VPNKYHAGRKERHKHDAVSLKGGITASAALQAGLSEAVNMGLKEGWIPTGALQSARGLQKRLSLMSS
jgi:hypothetical protein